MQSKYLFILGFILAILVSCKHDSIVFTETVDITNDEMNWSDSIVFKPEIPDTSSSYTLSLTVAHDVEFKYQNFYLNLYTHYPQKLGAKGLVSVQLQGKDGRWSGDCSRYKCEQEVILKKGIKFKQSGNYYITVHQASRDSILSGLHSIGLTLEKM